MSPGSSHGATISTPVKVLSLLVSMLLGLTLLSDPSSAVFTGVDDNTANNFVAATVSLSDDDSGSALFTSSAMVPSQTEVDCITASYTGTTFNVTQVKLYASIDSQTNNFADHLDVVIEEGTGGSFGDCTGFTASSTVFNNTLSSMASSHTNFSNGIGLFTPSSGDVSRTYRFSITLGADTPDAAQGDSASTSYTWEIQSA